MDSIKQAAYESYGDYIEKMEITRKSIELLPDGLAELGAHIYDFTDNLRVDIPHSLETYKKLRRKLGKDWRFIHTHDNNKTSYRHLRHKSGVILTVGLRTDYEGATCRLEKIGQELKDIYKIVCS